jgi:hypothetical protein
MDIGKCFKDAWGLFRIDLGPLVAAAAIAAVIMAVVNLVVGLAIWGSTSALGESWQALAWGSAFLSAVVLAVTAILVYAWMYAVVFHMILRRVRDQRPAEYTDLQSFDQIMSFGVAAVILGFIIGIGYFLLIIPGLFLTTIWLYALPLIGDRRLGLSQAMAQSRTLAGASGLFTTFAAWLVGAVAVGVVVAILNSIPLIGLIIGLVAVPFGVAYVISMYFQSIGEGHLVTEAIDQARH